MDVSKITTQAVEASLKAMRDGRPPHDNLLSIPWDGASTPSQNSLALEDLINHSIRDAYGSLRRAEGLDARQPENRQELLQNIQQDFRFGNVGLEAWSALNARYVVPIEISVEELARGANVVPQQFRRRVRSGLTLLTQILRRRAGSGSEIIAPPAVVPAQADLPLPDYTLLVGVQLYSERLLQLFSDPAGPGMVSLEGMGGIGKSAVARAFIGSPQVTENWKQVVWVSARQSMLAEDGQITPLPDSAATLEDISIRLCEHLGLSGLAPKALKERLEGLRATLTLEAYLVVVDNLETVEEYRRLVPALGKMAGKSRFLITTRQTLRDFDYVHTMPVKELNDDNAYELIRSEIARRGRSTELSSANFKELYRVIGGLPLALKLSAAQLDLRPLKEILDGFRRARGGVNGLYRFLYWQTWYSLSDQAHRLLLSFLPADPEGEDIDFLRVMSGQEDEEFFAALKELDQFSLLEVSGEAGRPLYRLHRLTVTFLQTDILKIWLTPSVNAEG